MLEAQAPALGEMAPPSAKALKKVKSKKAPLNSHGPIPKPVKLVHRKSGKVKPQAYLLAGGRFLCGQSSTRTSSYLQNVQTLLMKIENNEVGNVEAAKKWLRERLLV